jgi:hypothetical protein
MIVTQLMEVRRSNRTTSTALTTCDRGTNRTVAGRFLLVLYARHDSMSSIAEGKFIVVHSFIPMSKNTIHEKLDCVSGMGGGSARR